MAISFCIIPKMVAASFLRAARGAALTSTVRTSSLVAAASSSLSASAPAGSAGHGRVWYQSVRWMGRGPTIQGRKNATDAVSSYSTCVGSS